MAKYREVLEKVFDEAIRDVDCACLELKLDNSYQFSTQGVAEYSVQGIEIGALFYTGKDTKEKDTFLFEYSEEFLNLPPERRIEILQRQRLEIPVLTRIELEKRLKYDQGEEDESEEDLWIEEKPVKEEPRANEESQYVPKDLSQGLEEKIRKLRASGKIL